MSAQERITWSALSEIIRSSTVPVAIRLDGPRLITLRYTPATTRLALRLPGGGEVRRRAFRDLTVEVIASEDGTVIEVGTSAEHLFPYFHAFALSVGDRIQVDGSDPADAVEESIERWEELLHESSGLKAERQTGLLGELWLLRQLMRQHGDTVALDAWVGPAGEAHDFRLGTVELEVKTTRAERRVHVISSETQLAPSDGCSLYLVSIQLAAAGAGDGFSLCGAVSAIRAAMPSGLNRSRFEMGLAKACGSASPVDVTLYSERLKLRSGPELVLVNERFPRLVRSRLADLVDMTRISDVTYRVDVEGLGHGPGTAVFDSLIGEISYGIG